MPLSMGLGGRPEAARNVRSRAAERVRQTGLVGSSIGRKSVYPRLDTPCHPGVLFCLPLEKAARSLTGE